MHLGRRDRQQLPRTPPRGRTRRGARAGGGRSRPDHADADGGARPTPTRRSRCGSTSCRSEDGAPVAGAPVVVERRVDGAWQRLGDVVTDEAGHAELAATLRRTPGDNVFRAAYAGDSLHAGSAAGPVAVALVRRASRLTVGGPGLRDRRAGGRGPGPMDRRRRGSGRRGGARAAQAPGRRLAALPDRADRRRRAGDHPDPAADRHPLAGRGRAPGLGRGRRAAACHRVDNLPPGRAGGPAGRARRARGSSCRRSRTRWAPARTRPSPGSPTGSGAR